MIFHDTNDEAWVGTLGIGDNVAYGVECPQIFSREGLIHDQGLRRGRGISIGEIASLQNLHAHGAKVIRAYDVSSKTCLVWFDPVRLVTVHKDAGVVVGPSRAGPVARHGNALYAWDRSQSLLQRDEEGDALLLGVDMLRMHAEDQQALWLLPKRSLQKVLQRAQEQPRTDQQ